MKIQSIAILIITVLAGAVMQGCATPESPPKFPDPQAASPPGGTVVNMENLRNVTPGLSKDQIYALIGPPNFNEWFVGNHVWNYLIDFRPGDQTAKCQYQIQFDKNMKVSDTYWREASCADLVKSPKTSR